MAYRVIIHVGPWKTGSTALQDFFHLNRDLLLSYGILYPHGIVTENAQHEIPNTITGSMVRFPWVSKSTLMSLDQMVKVYFDEMRKREVSTLLLSSEDFAGLDSVAYSRLTQVFRSEVEIDLEFIYFDFDPKERLNSYIGQYIRQGEYVDNKISNQFLIEISDIVSNWASAIANISAIVHRMNYQNTFNSNDIYEKTLNVILNDEVALISGKWSIPRELINSSMPAEQIDFLNDFNMINTRGRSFDRSFPLTFSDLYPVETNRLQRLIEILHAAHERDSAVAERDSAVAERDSAVAERDAIVNSNVWKVFKPYRVYRNYLRKSWNSPFN